jgi:hypothetical protein
MRKQIGNNDQLKAWFEVRKESDGREIRIPCFQVQSSRFKVRRAGTLNIEHCTHLTSLFYALNLGGHQAMRFCVRLDHR